MEKRLEKQADGILPGCLISDYTLEFLLFSSLFFLEAISKKTKLLSSRGVAIPSVNLLRKRLLLYRTVDRQKNISSRHNVMASPKWSLWDNEIIREIFRSLN